MKTPEKVKELQILREKVFALANELAKAGYGDAAVRMHLIHNVHLQNQ